MASEGVIAQLLRLTVHVDQLVDNPEQPPGPPIGPMNHATRTPLLVTAERSATQDDMVQDLERHYLLMVDYLRGVPEFTEMALPDQEQLAQRRFLPFYWLKLTQYTWKTKCAGICLANGSFYPGSLEHQPCPDVTRLVSRLDTLLPIYSWLRLDEKEMALLTFIILFHDDGPVDYDKLAIRMSRIMLFVNDLTCMTHFSFSNMQVHEIMHVINWKKAVDGRLAWIHG
ncbi:unnamed protein product, partial [Mesorhabditis spiculigera]